MSYNIFLSFILPSFIVPFLHFFFIVLILQIFCLYNVISNFIFIGNLCVQMCVSQHLANVSCALSLALLTPHPICIVLQFFVFNSSQLYFFRCLYSNVKDKGRVWTHVSGNVGKSLVEFDGGETAIRIYYIMNFLIN